MAALDDVISLPRLRDAIGGVSDSDAELDPLRKAAIGWLEHYTGRVIIDNTKPKRSAPDDFGYSYEPDAIWFNVPDIKSTAQVTLHYSLATEEPAGRPSTMETVDLSDSDRRNVLEFNGLTLFGAMSDTWGAKIRYVYPKPFIEIAAGGQGMSGADIPKEWEAAAAIIVRALYDGTAYDDLGKHSSLKLILMPWYPTGELRRL